MMMDDLFLNFELQLAYTKLRGLSGKSKTGEGRKMVECEYVGGKHVEKWIWFAGVKFILRRGMVEIRDLDYGYMVDARVITNDKYLVRVADIIAKTSPQELWRNRNNRLFFRSKIRGVGRFTDNHYVKDEVIEAIAKRCLDVHPMDLAAEYGVSEFLVRKIRAKVKDEQKKENA